MKFVAKIPQVWAETFQPLPKTGRNFKWQDRESDRIILRSYSPDPWGQVCKVHFTADFGETRGGRRYEKRGTILVFPLDDEPLKLLEVFRESRFGFVFLLDFPGTPVLVRFENNQQIVYGVKPSGEESK